MPWLDVTLPLDARTPAWPGDPRFRVTRRWTPVPGDPDGFAMARLSLGTHAGTHLDAPRHFLPGGATVDGIDPGVLCGPAQVLDVRAAGGTIDEAALAAAHDWRDTERVLLRTAGGDAALTAGAARFLRDRTRVRLVGIDTLSIEAAPGHGFPVHRTLLGAEPPILILESLDLRAADAGPWELVCLPLRLAGLDASPVRAFLRR